MNPADLAIVALTVVNVVATVTNHRHRMKIADRERLVGPVKAPQPKHEAGAEAPAADDEEPRSILLGRTA
jgi:hypothetical protein